MDKLDLFSILSTLKNTAELRLSSGKTSAFEAGYSLATKHLFELIENYDPDFYEELKYYLNCPENRRPFNDEFYEPLDI